MVGVKHSLSKKNKTMLLFFSVLAIIVGGILLYYFVFSSQSRTNNSNFSQTSGSLMGSEDVEALKTANFIIYRKVDFDNHPRGYYEQEQFSSDWKTGEKFYQPNTTRIDTMGSNNMVMVNYYPKGTFGRGGGLNQFSSLDGGTIEEAYLTYRFKFEAGFEWGLTGKMPGFIYGKSGTVASGGDGPEIGDKGSSVRLIWNEEGKLNFYIYHHQMKEKYGENLGTDFFGPVESGVWHELTMRLVTNDLGAKNGICQVWLDGELKASIKDLELRIPRSPRYIEAIALSTFMGGADDRFAAPKDQAMYMDDFYVWNYNEQYIRSNPTIQGHQLIGASHHLLTPLSENRKD